MKDLQKGYDKVNTFTMLKELLVSPNSDNLRLIQKDELRVLENKNVPLTTTERNYIKTLHQNFVLNGFRFKDKIKTVKKDLKINRPQHVGLLMLNSL